MRVSVHFFCPCMGSRVWAHVCMYTCCLSYFCYCLMKHHNQNTLREERAYLAYTFSSLFITEGSQDKNSSRERIWRQEHMQGHQGGLFTSLLFMACSACFHIEPLTISPGMALPTVGRARGPGPPPPPSAGSYGASFSVEVPSFQMTVTCAWLV